MKNTHTIHTQNILTIASLLLLAAACSLKAATGNDTWTGGGSDAIWSDTANWSGVNPTPQPGDTPMFGTVGTGGATLNNDLTAATSFLGLTFNAGAPSFTLGGNSITTTGGIVDNSLNLETINLPIILSGTHSVNAISGGTMVINGVISGSAVGINKTGGGTVTLTGKAAGANTYTGTSGINAGTLTLDFTTGGSTPAANIISSSSPLSLGGGTLNINGSGSAASSQTFNGITVGFGGSILSAAPASGANYPTVTLGAIAYAAGGAVEFVGPAYNNAVTTTSGQAGTGQQAATATATTTSGVANAALYASATGVSGGSGNAAEATFATVGLYDFAIVTGTSPFTVAGASQGTGGTAGDGAYTLVNGGNMPTSTTIPGLMIDALGTVSGHNSSYLAGIRFNAPGANLTSSSSALSVGALLVTPNVGANNVTLAGSVGLQPGFRSSSNPGSTIFWQNNVNGFLNITGTGGLGNNGKAAGLNSSFVQAGPGTVDYTVQDYYTGPTYLDGGVAFIGTTAAGDAAFGAAATAAAVNLNGGTIMAGATFTLDNAGANPRPVTLGNNGGGLAAATGNTLTVDGVVSGSGTLTIGIPASSANGNVVGQLPGTGAGTANTTATNANGTVALTGNANTYSGGTVIYNTVLSFVSGGLGTGGVTFNGGTLQWGGSTTTDISAQTVTIASAGATLDVNGNVVTLASSIGNSGSGALTVASTAGGGSLTLSGANTYTGGTTVNSGATLLVNGSTSSGTMTVNGTLGGTGTVGGNTTLATGATALLNAGSPLTISGALTLNNTTITTTSPKDASGSPYSLMNATSITGGSTVNATPGVGSVAAGNTGTVSISGSQVILTVVSAGTTGAWTDGNHATDDNWSDTLNWSGGVPHLAGDTALFGSTVSPVVLDANETVGALDFNQASSYTISGGKTLTLDNNGSGAAVNVTAGTANAIQTSVALNDNATVTVNGNESLAVTGTISNSPSVIKTLTFNGAGTNILSAANSYGPAAAGSTGTTLSGGILQLGNNSALGAGDLTVTANSVLQSGAAGLSIPNNIGTASTTTATVDNNGNALTLAGVISGSGNLSKINNGTLTLGVNNTYAGGTTINGGTVSILTDGASAGNAGCLGVVPASATANSVILNGGDLLGSGTFALNANRGIGIGPTLGSTPGTGLIDAASGQTFTVNGVIASAGNLGANNLTVNSAGGSGMVVLTAANNFKGTTVISAGTLQLGNPLALQNSTLNYSSGTLDFGTQTAPLLGGLSGSQNLSLLNDSSAAVALNVGTNNASTAYSGGLSGTGASLTKSGTGTLDLTGNNTYSGATTVNTGTLQLDTGGVLGGSSLTLGNPTLGTAGTFHLTGGTINTGGLNLNTSGNSGGSTGVAIFDSGSATFTSATLGNNQNGGEILINGGTVSLGAVLDRRDASSGTATLNAGLVINGGTVTASSVIISSGNSGADMTISNGSLTIGDSSTTGGFEVGTGSNSGRGGFLTVGGGALTYIGTDGLLLNTVSTCEGIAVFRGGTSTLTGITLNPPGNTGGNASLTIGGSAVVYLGSVGIVTNSGTATATINLSGGTVGAVADWSSTAQMFLIGTNTFQAADASANPFNITLSGVLGGNTNSAIIKTGNGTLTLSGANYFTNGVTVNAGILNINGINALGGAYYGGLTLNGGALQYATNSTGNGSLDISLQPNGNAGITLGTGTDVIDVNGNTVAYDGSIGNSGSGGLTVQSTVSGGVLNLLTNDTYTGNTLIGSGATLKVNNTNGSATGPGNVTVASGGTLGGNGIISGNVEIQSGGILAPGNSVGTNTVGALTLDSGAIINTEFNGSGNDRTVATGGLTVNGGIFNLYSEGSTAPWTTTGNFKLIQYSGADPSLDSSWTTASTGNPHVGNPQTSLKYAFTASGGYLTLTITLSGSAVAGSWTNDADGSWAAGANWDSNPSVPHAAGDFATFGAGMALRTVSLDGSKSVGTITFNNNNSFHVATGSGGTLTLDKNGSGANLYVLGGVANQIQTPVALNDNVTVGVNSGKSLAVSGNIANASAIAKTLTVNQPGTLALSGNNSYGPAASSGFGTVLTGSAVLQVGNNNALGAGDINFTGDSTLKAGAASLSVNNNVDVSPGVTATVDTAGQTLSMNGTLNDSGNLTKIGNGTLALPDNIANNLTGITTVNGGVLSVAYEGDVYQSTQIILNGGDLLGNGQSDNGYAVVIDPPIGIGPTLGAVGGTALVDATSGSTLTLNNIIASAGNSGANNLVVNSGAGNNGTVLVQNDANSFNGTTVISNGWLDVASTFSLQDTTLNYDNQGGVLVVDGGITGITLGGLEGAQDFGLTNLNGNALSLSVGQNNTSTTYSGNLSDPAANGGLTKVGTGTLTLAGTNSYIQPTTISAGVLRINTNGVLNTVSASVPSVGGAQLVVSGGTLTVTNSSNIGTPSAGLLVSSGSATFLAPLTTSLGVNNGNLIAVTGGSLTAANLSLGRTALNDGTQPVTGSTTAGLYVNGGAVDILGNLDMGITSAANSSVNTRIDSGSLTVGGVLTIGLNNGTRWSVVDVNGGSLTVTNATTGISVGGPLSGNAELLIRAGTVTAGIIGLGFGTVADTVVLNQTNGSLYLGSGGIVQVSPNATASITFSGGLLGAVTNWSCTNNIQFIGASYTIQTADSSGNPQNIYLGGTNSGGGALIKTGSGTLVLSNADIRTGATTISNGTLALVPGASLAATPKIAIVSGATFDVSALTGFTLTGSSPVQTLAGVSSSGTANVNVTGNALTLAPGATGLLNATGGGSPTVGKITVAGGLALNGNTIMVNVNGSMLGAGNYRLLDCTGNLTGSANATPAFTGLGATPGALASVSTTTGAAGHVDLTVSKATPALQTAVASTITNGATLGQSTLFVTFTNTAGGNVPGTYAFTSPGTIPPVGTAGYQVQFTPNDTANYNTPAPFNVNVTVLPSVLIPTQSAGITGFGMVNGNVVINGTNGETGGTYYLLETTNVADPISQWKAVATNVVSTNGPGGAFTFTGTNTVTPDGEQQFYILSNTNNQ